MSAETSAIHVPLHVERDELDAALERARELVATLERANALIRDLRGEAHR